MSRPVSSADVFYAISDPTRRRLLDLLGEAEKPVAEIAAPFRMSQPAISQHLRVLRDAGLVKQRKVGRQRLCSVDGARLKEVYDWVSHYERFWRNRLTRLGELLDREAVEDEASS